MTDDIHMGLEKNYPSDPKESPPLTEFLLAASDLGTLLYGNLSVSRWEEIAVVTRVRRRSECFAADLCLEALNLLSCSPDAMLYFIDGLQADGTTGEALTSKHIVSNTSMGDMDEMCVLSCHRGRGTSKLSGYKNIGPSSHIDIKSALLDLDSAVESLIRSVDLSSFVDLQRRTEAFGCREETSLTIIPSLLDTLRFCMNCVYTRQQEGDIPDLNIRLQSPMMGFRVLMDALFAVCRDEECTSRSTKFWKVLSSLNHLLNSARCIDLLGDKSDKPHTMSNMDMLQLCNNLMCVLSSVVHGMCDIKVNLLRSCNETNTKMLLPQIRRINYASPVVISNSSTDTGNYNLGFWIRIPSSFCESLRSDHSRWCRSNDSTLAPKKPHCVKTHILSRVPEAGEVDMTSLFKVCMWSNSVGIHGVGMIML